MRIVMLSDHETRGGAAVAATRLAVGLAGRGHEVWRLTFDGDASAGQPWQVARLTEVGPGAIERVPGRGVRHALRRPFALRALRRALRRLRPDVVNVHNLHGLWEYGWSIHHVAECVDAAPTAWTLHDMWSFTGRCAYTGGCERFLTGCGATCPTPEEYPSLPPSHIASAWRARADLLRSTPRPRLVAVTPSSWLAREASRGLWAGRDVRVIPNGLPLTAYRTHERAFARRALGLPVEGRVVLAVAVDLADPRKGMSTLGDALRRLVRDDLTLLVMGGGHLPALHLPVVNLGSTGSPTMQSLAYSAADVYVHPAREDNLPNTLLESLACGTPAVGFRIGGVPEVIRPGVTGWLVDEPGGAALSARLVEALDALAADDLRERCRAVAAAEFGDQLQATRYEALFEELRGGTAG